MLGELIVPTYCVAKELLEIYLETEVDRHQEKER